MTVLNQKNKSISLQQLSPFALKFIIPIRYYFICRQ